MQVVRRNLRCKLSSSPCRLLDTLPLARACLPGWPNHKQGTLRQRFGVQLALGEREHDAGTDVAVLAQLLPHLVAVGAVLPVGHGGMSALDLGTGLLNLGTFANHYPPICAMQASGARSLPVIADGSVTRRGGGGFCRTLASVQAGMRGAKAGEEGAAEVATFACPVCSARVVA